MKKLEETFVSGIIEDPREDAEKEEDFQLGELVSAPCLGWNETYEQFISRDDILEMIDNLPLNDQKTSSSCVAQAVALALGIVNMTEEGRFMKMSPRFIYSQRKNKPKEGMYFADAGALASKKGIVPNSLMDGDQKVEEEMNENKDMLDSFIEVAKIYKAKNYVSLRIDSIDEVAYILAIGKPVVLGFQFGQGEWLYNDVPVVNGTIKWGHGVCALPYSYFVYKGKKAILIQDSADPRRRIITEDWFTSGRCIASLYFEDLENLKFGENLPVKPKYTFLNYLKYGDRNIDVKYLQMILNYEKDENGNPLFPDGTDFTGYFGGITLRAVKRYQVKNRILQTGYFGNLTMDCLNKQYGI